MGVIKDIIGIVKDIKSINSLSSKEELNNNAYFFGSNYGTGAGSNYRSVGAKIEYGLSDLVYEHFDRDILIRRSRQTEFDSPNYRALVYWLSTYVIGSGLNISISPNWDILGIDDIKQREKYQKTIEHRVNNILKSKEVDFLEHFHTGQLFREIFKTFIVDGEVFIQVIYDHKTQINEFKLNPVKLRVIPTECIYGLGDESKDGIKQDRYGRDIGYYIAVYDVDDTSSYSIQPNRLKFKRVYYPKYTANGQIQIIHLANRNRILDTRGIPRATSLFHEFTKMNQSIIAELETQQLNSQIFGVVERDVRTENYSDYDVAGAINREERETKDVPKSDLSVWNTTGIILNHLEAGEKLKQIGSDRPNLNITSFIKEVLIPTCSSFGIPEEVLRASYNSNYSASRAAIEQMWKTVLQDRNDFIYNFASPYYKTLITELVYSGDLDLPYFLEDSNKRLAWLNHTWTGSAIPNLDPLKEVNALVTAIDNGLISRSEASNRLYGNNFKNNAANLSEENRIAKDLNINLGTQNNNVNNNTLGEENDAA